MLNKFLVAALLPCLTSSCVIHGHITDTSGLTGIRGKPIEYQTSTSYSLNALWIFSLLGDSSLKNTMREFTDEASARGADRFRITQTSSSVYWFVFPPISFFIHPKATTVEGDIEGPLITGPE